MNIEEKMRENVLRIYFNTIDDICNIFDVFEIENIIENIIDINFSDLDIEQLIFSGLEIA